MDTLSILISFLMGHLPCNATVFGYEGDAMKGGEAVCIHRELNARDIGIAHRDLPCGAKVVVENLRTGKKVVARVVDRGPYGATFRGRWVLKRKETDRGTWRGCVDLTARAARLLGHNGFEPVVVKKFGEDDGFVVKWFHELLVAQPEEQRTSKPMVAGSSPAEETR